MRKADYADYIDDVYGYLRHLQGTFNLSLRSFYITTEEEAMTLLRPDLKEAYDWIKEIHEKHLVSLKRYMYQNGTDFWKNTLLGLDEDLPEYVELTTRFKNLTKALNRSGRPILFYKSKMEKHLKKLKKAEEKNEAS